MLPQERYPENNVLLSLTYVCQEGVSFTMVLDGHLRFLTTVLEKVSFLMSWMTLFDQKTATLYYMSVKVWVLCGVL